MAGGTWSHSGLSGPFKLLHYLDAVVYPDIPPNLLIAGAVRLHFEFIDLRPSSPCSTFARIKRGRGAAFRSLVSWCVGGKLGLSELVDFCGQDEIALRQAVDLVRPGRDSDSSPGQRDVWVVTLLLREFAYAVYEFQSFPKVGKREGLRDVVFFDDVPAVHLLFEGSKLRTLERGDASSAWHACLGR